MPGPLERLLQPLERAELRIAPTSGPACWLAVDGWHLYARVGHVEERGELLARFALEDGSHVAARVIDGAVVLPFDPDEAFTNYVSEAWRPAVRAPTLSAKQLNAFYRVKWFIPRSAQLAARRVLAGRQRNPTFPRWPLDDSVVRLVQFVAACRLAAAGRTTGRFSWFWPDARRAALILTHDVESAEGLRLAVDIADAEEERGLRSSFNVVADWYPIDGGVLRDLRSRGFEIGVHGVHHDRSMFATRQSFEEQLPRVAQAAAEFEAEGFRSPATHRVFQWLGELPTAYDCSIPHSDPFEPQPGGCCSLWPFFIGDLVELPYTLPQDHTLFTLLGERTVEPWLSQLAAVAERFGLAQVVTHPDPGYLGDPRRRGLYFEFLDAVRERDGLWRTLPRDVARWWRERDSGTADGLAHGTMSSDGTLAPPLPEDHVADIDRSLGASRPRPAT